MARTYQLVDRVSNNVKLHRGIRALRSRQINVSTFGPWVVLSPQPSTVLLSPRNSYCLLLFEPGLFVTSVVCTVQGYPPTTTDLHCGRERVCRSCLMRSCELLLQRRLFIKQVYISFIGSRNISSGSTVASSSMQLRHSLAKPMARSTAHLSPIAASHCRGVATNVRSCSIIGSLRCHHQQQQLQARRCSALPAVVRGESAAVKS